MDIITFKNFRKLKDETTFELNNINLLVGPNNSGKSTLTKGITLYLSNILFLETDTDNVFNYRPLFRFGADEFVNPHIGTFGRALSKDSDENYIYFSIRCVDITIETIVSRYSRHHLNPNGEQIDFFDKTYAPITKVTVTNHFLDYRLSCDFEMDSIMVEFNITQSGNYYGEWKKKLEEEKEFVNKGIKDQVNHEWEVESLNKCLAFGSKNYIQIKSKLNKSHPTGKFYLNVLSEFVKNNSGKDNMLFDDPQNIHLVKDENFLQYMLRIFFETSDDLKNYIYNEWVTTIEAHSVTHSLVYNISNKNDYMAQTILSYINENIKSNDPEREFIEDWMMKFGIGEDFIIDSYGGESYKLEIIEDVDYPEKRTPLFDKGVGNNQLMILLLRLATIMHKNRGATIPNIVIIEEPEQNLHPKLQSMLAELFYEVYQYPQKINKESWGITFVIETHSEYLIRKSQVLVGRQESKKENPFTVYYMNENQSPRKIEYQDSGVFSDDFGEGFYDESIRLTEEIV